MKLISADIKKRRAKAHSRQAKKNFNKIKINQ